MPTPITAPLTITLTITLTEQADRFVFAIHDDGDTPLTLTTIPKPTDVEDIWMGVVNTFHHQFGDAGTDIADSIRETLTQIATTRQDL